MSYLARLPVDTLKIDRSFIAPMSASPVHMAIVTTVISLARSLNLRVVAEGVETEQQANLLRLLRCDEAQGYLYSKPVPPEDVPALIPKFDPDHAPLALAVVDSISPRAVGHA